MTEQQKEEIDTFVMLIEQQFDGIPSHIENGEGSPEEKEYLLERLTEIFRIQQEFIEERFTSNNNTQTQE